MLGYDLFFWTVGFAVSVLAFAIGLCALGWLMFKGCQITIEHFYGVVRSQILEESVKSSALWHK